MGLLRVDGGTFATPDWTMYVGDSGTGTVIVGENGSITANNLKAEKSGSTLRFDFGETGVGSITVNLALTAGPSSKLEIDTTDYHGDQLEFLLVDYGSMPVKFAEENITITGPRPATVYQDMGDTITLRFRGGTLILVR